MGNRLALWDIVWDKGAEDAYLAGPSKSRHRNRSVLETYTTLGDAVVSELTSWFDSPQERRQR